MDDATEMTGYWRLPCRTCGTEHKADCPDRTESTERVECSCDGGCRDCDWNGYNLIVVGGHKIAGVARRGS